MNDSANSSNLICPLTGAGGCEIVDRIDPAWLIELWLRKFDIDIAEELEGIDEVLRYRSPKLRFEFFRPESSAGSAGLYEHLQTFDWYYMSDKWEYGRTLEDFGGCQGRLLEIGCGSGAFLQQVRKASLPLQVEGLEINVAAAASARQSGLAVHVEPLASFAEVNAGCFDAVCTFQVLEHVPAPGDFLDLAVKLLKPGGRLAISVPDMRSILKIDYDNPLNMPPHHMGRWWTETFEGLTDLLPVSVVRIQSEPLAKYHVDYNVSRWTRWRGIRPAHLRSVIRRGVRATAGAAMKRSARLRGLFRGMTMYGCFEKRQ